MSHPEDREKLFETLRRQHSKLDTMVQEIESHRWLSPHDEQEVKRLKRLKLVAKDRMRTLQPEL